MSEKTLAEAVITLNALSETVSLKADEGENLLDVLRQRPDLAPPAPCAGHGRCGKCRIILEFAGKDGIPEIHEVERAVITDADLDNGVRLACRLTVSEGMRIRLEERGIARIETRVEGSDVELNPVLVKKAVILPVGSLEDQRSSAVRLEEALELPIGSLPHALSRLLPSIPDGNTPLTAILDDGFPVALDIGVDTTDALWTAAVDIGTTTVAMYLVNLADGVVAGSRAEMNRQGPFGADVISRLEYARKGVKETAELQSAIVGQLAGLLESLLQEHGVASDDIHMLAVAGNTAMIHLMAGWDSKGLGEAPFLPAVLESQPFPAEDIGFNGFSRLRIWPLPSLSAYVGADITSGIVASGMHNREGTDLLLDIGTNGEMALGGSGGLVCCSTAAGPAFEGAHLSSGVGSIPGAVDHVDWIDGRMMFSTIDKMPAVGFCGSGVVDLVAFFVKSGLMDDTGRFVEQLPEVTTETETDSEGRFGGLTIESEEYGPVFVWGTDTASDRRLSFNQKDLREVQLAKAAIAAGLETLLGQAGLSAEDVGTIWLAGGFGSYIRPDSAAAIGLIPANMAAKTRSLGNAAARGAIICLLSREKHQEVRGISEQAKTIELSGRPDFQNAYIEAMMFPAGCGSGAV